MKKLMILALPIFILGCKKDCDSLLPDCLNEKIERKEIQTTITRYNTQKGPVYEIYNGDAADVFDEKCKVVCILGGFVGNTICFNGTDTLTLSNPVVVWEK